MRSRSGSTDRKPARLPRGLRRFFWDYDFGRLAWETDRDLIIGRVLAAGDWPAVRWLNRRLGAVALRRWLVGRCGAGLSPRQLRFWEAVLHLERRQVDSWLAHPARSTWDRRCHQ